MKFTMFQRRAIMIALDLVVILAAFFAAFLLRFEFIIDQENSQIISQTIFYFLGAYILAAFAFALHRGMYHYSSVADLLNITKAVATGGIVAAMLALFIRQGHFPRSILILHPILTFLGMCAIRFGIRFIRNYLKNRGMTFSDFRQILLIGAGDLGESIARQIEKTPGARYKIMGFIDDDPAKWGMMIHGYPVLGGRKILADVLNRHEIDEVVVAISARRGDLVRSIVEILQGVNPQPELKIIPDLQEMLAAPQEGLSVRKVKPADLLSREVIKLDEARIAHTLANKCALITGAGGTIGSELCRQALRYGPQKLIILEQHATSLFYIEGELKDKARETEIIPVLGDVRDTALVERVFSEHQPQVVLHAAAHKHVHQLEFNVHEGISNNILGTHTVAAAAHQHDAETFLLISTDKAVRPLSVMGATKRVAEQVVGSLAAHSRTRFVGVRFGNVLGSSGSVLQIFQEQIARGGPVTVTDARATRYFMTVEEAVGLILQAVSMAKGGELFVLKMGTPVRILDMAKNLILLSGLTPGKDIEIREIGLRQGEKLDEELVEDKAEAAKSEHPDIMVLSPDSGSVSNLPDLIKELETTLQSTDPSVAVKKLSELVLTFKPASAHTVALDGR